jgi:hypothetical protein
MRASVKPVTADHFLHRLVTEQFYNRLCPPTSSPTDVEENGFITFSLNAI